MLNVLMKARVPLYMHSKSNHIYAVWQHLILLALRQYEGKSYRRFVEWLHEAYYLRMFLQLSKIPHYTTFQKFAARMNGTLLYRIISSFILLTRVRKMRMGIDASGYMKRKAQPLSCSEDGSLPSCCAVYPTHKSPFPHMCP